MPSIAAAQQGSADFARLSAAFLQVKQRRACSVAVGRSLAACARQAVPGRGATAAMASTENNRPRGSWTTGVERTGGATGKYSAYTALS